MKRIISAVLALLLIISFAACRPGGSSAQETAAPANTGDPQEIEPTPDPTEPVGTEPSPTDAPEATPLPSPEAIDPGKLPKLIAGKDVFFVYFSDGSLYGWGNNKYGQLGNGTGEPSAVPVHIAEGLTPVIVGSTVLALGADGTLWGWGLNESCQLGLGDTENRLSPVEIMPSVKTVRYSWDRVFALTENGELWAWGVSWTDDEQNRQKYTTPQRIMEDVRYFDLYNIVTGSGELFTRFDGNWEKADENVSMAWGWGGRIILDLDGRLCERSRDGTRIVITEESVRSVSISDGTAYILTESGALYSWILEESIVAFTPEEDMHKLVFIMDGVKEFQTDFEVGEDWAYDYKFALKENGELWDWGRWNSAPLGREDAFGTEEPSLVASEVRSFVTNGASTYLIKNDGEIWAAGLGSDYCGGGVMNGSLGDGTNGTRHFFVPLGVKGAAYVLSGFFLEYVEYDDDTDSVGLYSRTFAVLNDGSILAWGWNGDGFLGTGSSEEDVLSPEAIYVTKDRLDP